MCDWLKYVCTQLHKLLCDQERSTGKQLSKKIEKEKLSENTKKRTEKQ